MSQIWQSMSGKKTKCQFCSDFFFLGLYIKQLGLCKPCYVWFEEVRKI